MRSAIELDQGMVDNQAHNLEQQQQEVKTLAANLESLKIATAECWSRVNLCQDTLQPVQDYLNGLRQKLQGINDSLAQVQETGDYQLQTITEMRQTLQSLLCQPELVAS
jgi:chromosome segregation ATPase